MNRSGVFPSLPRVLKGEFPAIISTMERSDFLPPVLTPLPFVRGAVPPIAQCFAAHHLGEHGVQIGGLGVPVSPWSGCYSVEAAGPPRFLDSPCMRAPFSDPGKTVGTMTMGIPVLPSAILTASALAFTSDGAQ